MSKKNPTPAEILAANKPRRKLRSKPYKRKAAWTCRITELRHQLRISLDDVAKEVGISKTALWQIEHAGHSASQTSVIDPGDVTGWRGGHFRHKDIER